MENRTKIFDKLNNKIENDSLGEIDVDEEKIKNNSLVDKNGKIKIPKDFKKEFYKLDKITLIEKVFNLKLENEILRRRLDSIEFENKKEPTP